MRLLLVPLLLSTFAGCESFGGKNAREDKPQHSHLNVVLESQCARPVEVCYGEGVCATLSDHKPQSVRAETRGNQVYVTLKGTERSIYLDETFNQVEVDDSCGRLVRKIGPRRESTSAAAGGPSPDPH